MLLVVLINVFSHANINLIRISLLNNQASPLIFYITRLYQLCFLQACGIHIFAALKIQNNFLMKKILMAIMCGALVFVSCKKNDDDDNRTVQPSKLTVKWRQDSSRIIGTAAGIPFNYVEINDAGDYVDFRLDGKAYYSTGGYLDTMTYSFDAATNKILADNQESTVYFIGDNKMRMENHFDQGGSIVDTKSYFTKW